MDAPALPGVVEKRPGVFYRKSKALLHFHENPTGPYADVRVTGAWERHLVATTEQQANLLASLRAAIAGS